MRGLSTTSTTTTSTAPTVGSINAHPTTPPMSWRSAQATGSEREVDQRPVPLPDRLGHHQALVPVTHGHLPRRHLRRAHPVARVGQQALLLADLDFASEPLGVDLPFERPTPVVTRRVADISRGNHRCAVRSMPSLASSVGTKWVPRMGTKWGSMTVSAGHSRTLAGKRKEPLSWYFTRSGAGGDDGNRTHVQGFAGPCLNHSATSPDTARRAGARVRRETLPACRSDGRMASIAWLDLTFDPHVCQP